MSAEFANTRGRGFDNAIDDSRYAGMSTLDGEAGRFESLSEVGNTPAVESTEGYVVYVGNVHNEAQEDDISELFEQFGEVKQVNLAFDKRTGYCKGFALVQMADYDGAYEAVKELNGAELFELTLVVDWAFKKK